MAEIMLNKTRLSADGQSIDENGVFLAIQEVNDHISIYYRDTPEDIEQLRIATRSTHGEDFVDHIRHAGSGCRSSATGGCEKTDVSPCTKTCKKKTSGFIGWCACGDTPNP